MINRVYRQGHSWLKEHWRRVILLVGVGLAMIIMSAQFAYPSSRLLPFTNVEGIDLSLATKAEAIQTLNQSYANAKVPIYFGEATISYRQPLLIDLGIIADNTKRVEALTYPWYLRLIPSSVVWGHMVLSSGQPNYIRDESILQTFMERQIGIDCSIDPQNASLEVVEGELSVIPSQIGGTCQFDEVKTALSQIQPDLTQTGIVLPVDPELPEVSVDKASELRDTINTAIQNGKVLNVNDKQLTISRQELLDWMEFKVVDGKLTLTFSASKAEDYMNKNVAPDVKVAAGTTTITTYDFLEISRQVGIDGRALDVTATLANIADTIVGKQQQADVVTKSVAPAIKYNRTYSPTDIGLAALMENYAKTHDGTYGISLIELSGQRRNASYQGDKQFTTASTYKLFVAYSTLLRIESGDWKWTDKIHGGRDLEQCFDDMIVLSDNECAHAMLDKIGYVEITNEAHAIGAVNTSWLGNDGIKSTARDEALLLSFLETNQILSKQSSRDLWLDAMKRNIYRQGIPKGIPTATVADKVGFLWDLLHDAAIVYSPSGTYVLVIMTDQSSWANIAELAGQIEDLRSK